jgi:universal stress protein A
MADSEGPEPSLSTEDVTIVLAAVDTSTNASRVIDLAARLARRAWPNAQLHLLHVFRMSRIDRPAQAGIRAEDLVADAQEYLDHQVRMARRQSTTPVTGHVATGDPVEEILKRARSLGADLLIMGTHDRVGLDRFLLGSVTAKVSKRAPCSVVIVRQKQRPYRKMA